MRLWLNIWMAVHWRGGELSEFYWNDPKSSDRQVWANRVDPYQTARGAVWSESTLLIILSACSGCLTLCENLIFWILG